MWNHVEDGFKLTASRFREIALFELSTDPEEQKNLAPHNPQRAQQMMVLLRGKFQAEGALGRLAPWLEFSEQDKAKLRALGYL